MGASGVDVLLSDAAFKVFPFSVECKNQEKLKQLYDMYDQESAAEGDNLLVVKMNRREPLAVLDLDVFFKLVKKCQEVKNSQSVKKEVQ